MYAENPLLLKKFAHLIATAMTACWPSQWKNCMESLENYVVLFSWNER